MALYDLTSAPREDSARPALTLVLLHHACGSSRGFGPFLPHLPRSWRILGVDLPGRLLDREGARCRTFEEAVGRIHSEMWPELDGPYAVFGHSMGALLAFEVVRRLEATGRGPQWLGVSGALAPQAHRGVPAHVVRHALGPMTGPATAHPGLVRLVERTVRADLDLVDGYTYTPGRPLRTELAVFGGADDPLTPVERLDRWSAHASRPVAHHLWPGGHFYLFDEAEDVCARLVASCTTALTAEAPAHRR